MHLLHSSLISKTLSSPMSLFVLGFLRLFFFSSVILFRTNNALSNSTHQCFHDHFSALLDLKQGFWFHNHLYAYSTTKLSSWNPNDSDCCHWEGVTCDEATGHVIGLDLSSRWINGQLDSKALFRLHSLQKLNLAYNDFDYAPFPFGFGQLENLTHLNLTDLEFYGQIPLDISQLTKLFSLDLSYNYGMKLEHPDIATLFQNLSNLRVLYLNYVDVRVQGSEWSRALSFSLPHLRKLSLSYCGLSISIHSFISQFHYLSELDLSGNNVTSEMLTLPLPHLHKLRLSDCGLSTSIHSFLSQLQFLSELDLSDNNFSLGLPAIQLPHLRKLSLSSCSLSTSTHSFLFQLPSLCELDLSLNYFSSGILDSIGNLSSLTSLNLRYCELWGRFPESLLKLNNIRYLDLSGNLGLIGKLPEFSHNNSLQHLIKLQLFECNFSGLLPPSLGNLDKLVYLDLSYNSFNGLIPSSYGNGFPKLQELILFGNMLSGTIPSSLFSLPSLKSLDLSYNKLNGQFVEFHNVSSSVVEIFLLDNNFHGQIPRSLFELSKLRSLDLSTNNFSGISNLRLVQNHTNFFDLRLSNNNLFGPLPFSLQKLKNLAYLDLSFNSFKGPIPTSYFNELPNLRRLFLYNNLLNGAIPSSLFSHPSLEELDLGGNQFGGQLDEFDNASSSLLEYIILSRNVLLGLIPNFLKNQEQLRYLDLSNNRIRGEIPKWVWDIGNGTLSYLNLSHNALNGLEQSFSQPLVIKVHTIDLSSNKLEGSLPIPSSSTFFLSLSNNHFYGEIPSIFCNATSLKILDLSENYLHGQIPPCLGEIDGTLNVLKLRKNAFTGTFVPTFKKGCNLQTLDVSENRLEGHILRSLINCTKLEVLNMGNNQMHDTFPSWLGTLSGLRILILRSNKFHGPIEDAKVGQTFFPLLQIIDLSSNNFTGSLLPNMFQSWKEMMRDVKSHSTILRRYILGNTTSVSVYYEDTVMVTTKGMDIELAKILDIFDLIDLSDNKFQGGIPESIGNLKSLAVLNMSHNDLTGPIPASFRNLLQLESLDLSQNKLSGEIPWQLTDLTFLEVVNFSQNRLVGRIPQSRQFLTFTNESFMGNSGLCGAPLSKKCSNDEDGPSPSPLPSKDATARSKSKFNWRSVWIGFGIGHGVGLGLFCWTLVLWNRGRRVYYNFIDRLLYKFSLYFLC